LTIVPISSTIAPDMSTIGPSEDLAASLFGKTRRAVLALLYAHPDEAFYLRQVVRALGAGQGAVQRELHRLCVAGILTREGRGREVYYRANRECPVFPELRGLMLKTAGMGDVLRKALAPLRKAIQTAFVYGSQAAGTTTAASDVDLLVIGDVDEMVLHRAIAQAERQLGRTVSYTLLSRREFARRRKESQGFLTRVLAGPKISVVGSADEV
jgi:predicted nucleotidyltransferase